MNVFAFRGYKDFLRSHIRENRRRGVISELAELSGCDRTYLSQVLNGKADLTPDHLIQLCDNLNLGEVETQYLLLVLIHDRSSSLSVRRSLTKRLERLRRDALALSNKIHASEDLEELPPEMRTEYYSSWTYAAIHILTSVPAYQTVAALAERLQMAPSAVQRLLKRLAEMKAVARDASERYVHRGRDLYLPQHHPQSSSNHLNWRIRAVGRCFEKADIHYTNVFAASAQDAERLREQIMELIEDHRRIVRESGSEEAFAFCCDFFEA